MDVGVGEIRNWHTWPKFVKKTGTYRYRGKTYSRKLDLPPSVRNKEGNGWSDVGYHYVIRRNGVLEDGRPNQKSGAHAAGFNRTSIGICLVGGLDDNGSPSPSYTKQQMTTLRKLVDLLQHTYNILDRRVLGHCDLPKVRKACPCFSVAKWQTTNELIR